MSAAGVGGRQEGMVIMAKKHVQKGNVQKKKTPAGKVSEKKLHMGRNAVILILIASILTYVGYNSMNIYRNTVVSEYMNLDETVGYTINGSVYAPVEGEEHIMKFSTPEQFSRAYAIYLNSGVQADTAVQAKLYFEGNLVRTVDSVIPASEASCTIITGNEQVDQVWVTIEGMFDYNNATAETLYENDDNASQQRLIKLVLMGWIVLVVLAVVLARTQRVDTWIDGMIASVKGLPETLHKNGIRYLKRVGVFVVAMAAGNVIWAVLRPVCLKSAWSMTYTNILFGSMIGLITLLVLAYALRRYMKFETLYIACTLMMSMVLALSLPLHLNLSWDDQIHFQGTAVVSHMDSKEITLNEQDFWQSCFSRQLKSYGESNRKEMSRILNDKQDRQTSVLTDYGMSKGAVVYTPMALTIFIARGLGIPASVYLVLGRMASAWFFFLLVYLGMRHLKSGKLVMAACSLIPICLFEVSNYNYDYWLVGFTIYAIAYLMGEYQTPDKSIRMKDILIIFGAFLLGGIVKPVYVPLLGLAAFLPRTKFASKRFWNGYHIFFLSMVGLAAAGFALLIFGGFLGGGDMRGGTEVSAPGQIQYITSNFKQYCIVIFNFLKDYLSVKNIQLDLADTAYITRKEWLGTVVMIWLLIVAFIDRNKEENKRINCFVKIAVIPLVLIAVWCVATAMYVMFTPVGCGTVYGCSGRYLMPVLFPLMIVISRIRFAVIPQPDKVKPWIDAGVFGVTMILAGAMMSAFV